MDHKFITEVSSIEYNVANIKSVDYLPNWNSPSSHTLCSADPCPRHTAGTQSSKWLCVSCRPCWSHSPVPILSCGPYVLLQRAVPWVWWTGSNPFLHLTQFSGISFSLIWGEKIWFLGLLCDLPLIFIFWNRTQPLPAAHTIIPVPRLFLGRLCGPWCWSVSCLVIKR